MFQNQNFLSNQLDSNKLPIKKEAGFEVENRKEKMSDEIVSFIVDNYLDEEGNFNWWESFGEKKIGDEELMKKTKKILNDQKVSFDDFEYSAFETFMFQEKTFEKIFDQYEKEEDLLRKIKIIKLFSDLILDFARSSQGERDSYSFFKKFKDIIDDPKESYLIRIYAKINYFENLGYYSIDNRVDDEEFEEALKIDDMHDSRFKDLNFSFDQDIVKFFINNREGIYNHGDVNYFNLVPYSEEERDLNIEYDSRFPDKKIDCEYFTRELAPGIVGSYTGQGELVGWQEYNKKDLKEKNSELNFENPAKILENLEISNRDDIIFFKMMSNLKFCKQIEKDFGTNINNFSLRVQFQFLNFIKKADIKETNRAVEFFNETEDNSEKDNRIKSFLSLEFDRENGEKILNIGEKLETGDAQKVFAKISELGDLAQKKDKELASAVYNYDQKEIPASVRSELLRKAHNIIGRFSDELKKEEKIDREKILKLLADLDQSRIEIDLVASLLIAGKKEGKVQNLEDIKGLKIFEVDANRLAENKELADKLREMYRTNNSHKSKEDLERLMSDFEKHLKYESKFYAVYFDKEGGDEKKLESLVGFMRSSNFDGQKELGENERYLGAMNIDPLLQKFYFGENFLREIMEKEKNSGAKKLIAHVPENGPTHKIIKNFNFKDVIQEGEYKNDDGSVLAKRIRVELTKS